MNPFLIEPYNAYQKPARKKHWMEIAEEEALYHRMCQDALLQEAKIQEAKNQQMTVQDSIQDGRTSAQTQNNVSPAAGAGGVPPFTYFSNIVEVAAFSLSPTSGDGPLTLTFINSTPTPGDDTFLWLFGTGSLSSTSETPTPQLYTATGSFTITLQSTSSTGNASVATQNITITSPTVVAGFTISTASNIGPVTASFTNTSTNSSQTPTTTYNWLFGDGTTSSLASPVHNYSITGSVTASLQTTGSYGKTSVFTQSFSFIAPTLTVGFTLTTSSNSAPSTGSFVNTTTYNGSGALTYRWLYGSGSLTSSAQTPNPLIYNNSGPYTASLQVTESSYNIKSAVTRSWRLT